MSSEDPEKTQKTPGSTGEQQASEGRPEASGDRDAAVSGPPSAGTGAATNVAGEIETTVTAASPPRERKPKIWRSGLVALGASLVALLLMSDEHRLRIGVPLGIIACVVAVVGFLKTLGTFEAQNNPGPVRDSLPLKRPLVRLALSSTSHFVSILLAVAGVLPLQQVSAALLVTATFVWMVIDGYGVLAALRAFGEEGDPTSPHRHLGFWLIVVSAVLYLPMLGSFTLIDPWETHYGEVAREMLARDDWISLWWAQDGWFWSKPILNFWVQALSFKIFGVHYMPDQMILAATVGRVPQPEWACRLPIFWMTVGAGYALYRVTRPGLGARGAFVGGLVLISTPYWSLIARQTMTDMPYVAALTAAMGALLLGFQTDPEKLAGSIRIRIRGRDWHVGAFHVVFGAVLLCVLPQVLYLLSRNVTLHVGVSFDDGLQLTGPFGFRVHLDEFSRGSGGGNCGQPGNKSCRPEAPEWAWAQPVWSALVWSTVTAIVLFWKRRERRLSRLYFLAAWLFTALAVLAKGAPGLAIPLATVMVFPAVTGRLRDYLRLEFPCLLLLLLAVAAPWYVQALARHGVPFLERLVLHDMVKRAFNHVHDTNKGDDLSFRYYIWQLGYGLFPWTGFAGAGVLWALKHKDRADSKRSQTNLFLMIWLMVGFGMFTITLTKFHHYVLPLVPPISAMAGVVVSHYLPARLATGRTQGALYLGGLGLGALVTLYGIMRFFPGRLDGKWFDGEMHSTPWLGVVSCVMGLAMLAATVYRFRDQVPQPDIEPSGYQNATLGLMAIVGTVFVTLAGLDMAVTVDGDVEGQNRLLHLFTYNYARDWPETVNFRATLAAFTLFFTVCGVLLAVPKWRRHLGVIFCCGAALWTVWCVDVYLVVLGPHWGQRETMLAYYQNRKDSTEPLIAYQMNWKGENFYTGNKMATFVSSGKKFKRWLKKQRRRGVNTMFVTTEHSRIKNLKRELEDHKTFTQLTDKTLNNKFFLAKVEWAPLPPAERKAKSTSKSTSSSKSPPSGASRPGQTQAGPRHPDKTNIHKYDNPALRTTPGAAPQSD